MKTKEDVIKEAYGEFFEVEKENIDTNGWTNDSDRHRFNDLEFNEKHSVMRPLSLKGIENNNGWIKIESEADLPKIIGDYWSFDGKEVCNHHFEHSPFWIKQWKYVTHYQPIQKPNPPVF
jgi:hypothetical protein